MFPCSSYGRRTKNNFECASPAIGRPWETRQTIYIVFRDSWLQNWIQHFGYWTGTYSLQIVWVPIEYCIGWSLIIAFGYSSYVTIINDILHWQFTNGLRAFVCPLKGERGAGGSHGVKGKAGEKVCWDSVPLSAWSGSERNSTRNGHQWLPSHC